MSSVINQEWFQDRLKAIKLSQRQLAKKMSIDPASMSNMLAGKRAMSMGEAKAIAEHILVPVTEVMRQAGIEVVDDVRKTAIAGYVAKQGIITLLPNGTHDTVVAPADCPANTFALQLRAVNSIRDGWLFFVSGTQQPPQDALDKLCVLSLKDGRMMLAVLRRGYKRDLYNLIVLADDNDDVLENKEVAWAARVLWVQPT